MRGARQQEEDRRWGKGSTASATGFDGVVLTSRIRFVRALTRWHGRLVPAPSGSDDVTPLGSRSRGGEPEELGKAKACHWAKTRG
jgi:hypothetical protein